MSYFLIKCAKFVTWHYSSSFSYPILHYSQCILGKQKIHIPFRNSLPAPALILIKFRLSFETVVWKCLYLGDQKRKEKVTFFKTEKAMSLGINQEHSYFKN